MRHPPGGTTSTECGSPGPTPPPPPVVTHPGTPTSHDLIDAAVRAGALARDQARAGKAAQLAGSAVVRNLAAALDRLDAADPTLAAETDAVRLALAPLR